MDLVDPIVRKLTEEREDDMSNLPAGFTTRMRKRTARAQEETTLGSEVLRSNCLKRSGPDEEAKKSPVVITVDSLERAPDALSTLKEAAQDASNEPYALMEDGAPAGGPPKADQAISEALAIKITIGPPL